MSATMGAFLVRTIVCTGAIVGFLLLAYIVAKNCMNGTVPFRRKKSNLEIEESLAISPRKTLHIIKAFDEKFLIASDATSTILLAKLNAKNEIIEDEEKSVGEFSSLLETKDIDASEVLDSKVSKKTSVIQSMLEKLNNN